MIKRLATVLGLLVLSAWSIRRLATPPSPIPATSADTVFSAERALTHVEQIAARPHAIGMPDHDRVRDYIVTQLNALGLRAQIQTTTGVGTRYQTAGRVQNILAWLPGSDAKGKALLVVAHYDGVEAAPAAADDGAGAAAILETLRALKARNAPLAHDVIVLFTDGEEAGLIGAAAFVREHPWAKDIAVVINFEARGTGGRSLMFETGPGDMAAVDALSHVGNVTAGSVFTAVYRTLPNDTDLSELAVLRLPALNFAFGDGVERYHTSRDDFAHLDAGSVQHHGSQMLGLVQRVAGGTLPLPKTGDAVFFDFPLLGLVTYPTTFAVPLAIFALVIVAVAVFRVRKGVIVGFLTSLLAVIAGGYGAMLVASLFAAVHAHLPWGGATEWRGIYGVIVALVAIGIALVCYSIGSRWATDRGLQTGSLVLWSLLGAVLSVKAPGASYLFVWPTLFAGVASLAKERWSTLVWWIAAAVAVLLLVGFTYGVSVVYLGVIDVGAIALGAIATLVTLLLMPIVAELARGAMFAGAGWVATTAVVLWGIALFTVRRSAEHPVRAALSYVANADSSDAWLGSFVGVRDPWSQGVIGPTSPPPAWMRGVAGSGGRFAGKKVERVRIIGPSATVLRDTVLGGARRIVLRVQAPPNAVSVWMRAGGARISSSSIDGRVVDTTRFRNRSRDWIMQYWAVPDTGAIVALSLPLGEHVDFDLTSRVPGLPSIAGVTIPPQPDDVVSSQTGDATFVYKRLRF